MEIRRIEHGEIITEPGFYDIPINWYHDNCCDGPSVSSTGLRTIDLQTPLHYWDSSYLNPNRDPDEDKKALEADHFRLGRSAHFRMLEPEKFAGAIAVRPEALWDSWRMKDARAWMNEHQKMGFTVLTEGELKQVDGIARSLNANPLIRDGLLGGAVETSLIVKDSKTGIWLKSRPDSIPIDDAFTDLKCMQDASPLAVDRAIRSLGYDMQMALAGVCLFNLTQRTVDTFWIVAVEVKRPHAIHIAKLSTDAVYWARIRLRKSLDTMAKCLADGDWPSYGADGQESRPSKFDLERYERDQKNAQLPQADDF